MPGINTRSATLADLEKLLEFEQGIIAVERAYDLTLKPGHINYYDIGKMIEAEDAEVLVVVQENNILASGSAIIKKAKPYQRFEQYCYLGFMYVLPEWRGQGINQQILDGLTEWSKKQGLNEIRLQVYADNDAAIRAYEKAGFTKDMIEMRINIE